MSRFIIGIGPAEELSLLGAYAHGTGTRVGNSDESKFRLVEGWLSVGYQSNANIEFSADYSNITTVFWSM